MANRVIPHEKALDYRVRWLMKRLCTGPAKTDREVEMRLFIEQTLTEVLSLLKAADTSNQDGVEIAAVNYSPKSPGR